MNLPPELVSAALKALQKLPGAGPDARLASAFLFRKIADVLLLASLEDAARGLGGALGAVWGARCNPPPATPAFPMTDAQWYDDPGITSQGRTSAWKKTDVRVVAFGSAWILCPWLDLQIRVRLDTADIARSIAAWTALAQAGVDNGVYATLQEGLAALGMTHLSRPGFFAHERIHVASIKAAYQSSRDSGALKALLDEAAAFISFDPVAAQAKARDLKTRLDATLDAVVLSGLGHSDNPASGRPPEGTPTAPLASDPMPAQGVSAATWNADQQALAGNGYVAAP